MNTAATGKVNAHEPDWRPVVASHDVDCWNDDVDVVGSGASALVAGVMAATGGARVIALEKASNVPIPGVYAVGNRAASPTGRVSEIFVDPSDELRSQWVASPVRIYTPVMSVS